MNKDSLRIYNFIQKYKNTDFIKDLSENQRQKFIEDMKIYNKKIEFIDVKSIEHIENIEIDLSMFSYTLKAYYDISDITIDVDDLSNLSN